MSNTPKLKILFFTPLAGRTGSEMMLMYLLKQFDRNFFEAQLISFSNGELLQDMPEDVITHHVPREFSLIDKIKFKAGINRITQQITTIQESFKADVWYLNTITMPDMVSLGKQVGVKIITHFHELPLSFYFLTSNQFQETIEQSNLLIGCAEIVSQRIKEAGGKNVVTHYEMIDCDFIDQETQKVNAIRKQLSIPENDFVWVMAGTTDERKGFDFLPKIAKGLNDPHVHLIWLGKRWDNGTTYWVEKLLENVNTTHIHLLGAKKEDYYQYLQIANGFMLTSREDPFPLVMLEAAYLGKPIVAFASGGVIEFVQAGMGAVIDSLNVSDFVAKMKDIMENKIDIDASKSIARASHFDVKVQVPLWEKLMVNFSNSIN